MSVTKKLSLHGKSCSCVECLCIDCGNTKRSVASKWPTTDVHPETCTCADCICKPCCLVHLKAKEHPMDCYCLDCTCKPCPKKSESCPDQPAKHTAQCICETCLKHVCKVTPHKKPCKAKKVHPPDCDCFECICNPCKPLNTSKLDVLKPHPKGCKCGTCRCEFKKRSQIYQNCKANKPSGDQELKNSVKNDCDCFDCKCTSCGDPKIMAKKHPVNCDCIDCLCKPCADLVISQEQRVILAYAAQEHPIGCMCEPCKMERENENKHPDGCDCDDCKCTPCADPNKSKESEQNAIPPCDCAVCNCNPCADPNQPPPACDCEVCKCNPCADPNIKGKFNFLKKTLLDLRKYFNGPDIHNFTLR